MDAEAEEKRKKIQKKYENMQVYHEFPAHYLGAARNRKCIIKIQQSTPKAPVVVRFQEIYATKDEPDNWKFGRQGISIPVETYIAMCDPRLQGTIGQMIEQLGLAYNDEEGLNELAMISADPVEVVEVPVAHHVTIVSQQPELITQWIQWFTQTTDLTGPLDPRVDRSTPGSVTLQRIPLMTNHIATLTPMWGQGITWEIA